MQVQLMRCIKIESLLSSLSHNMLLCYQATIYIRWITCHAGVKLRQADATIGVLEVPWSEAGRFGIMETTASGRIIDFVEKPCQPKGNQACGCVYFHMESVKTILDERRGPGGFQP